MQYYEVNTLYTMLLHFVVSYYSCIALQRTIPYYIASIVSYRIVSQVSLHHGMFGYRCYLTFQNLILRKTLKHQLLFFKRQGFSMGFKGLLEIKVLENKVEPLYGRCHSPAGPLQICMYVCIYIYIYIYVYYYNKQQESLSLSLSLSLSVDIHTYIYIYI